MLQEAKFYASKYSQVLGIALSQHYEPLYVTAWYDRSEDIVKLSYSYDNVEWNVTSMDECVDGVYSASLTVYDKGEPMEQAHITCTFEADNIVMHIV